MSYLVKASIHFNRFPIELFILFSLSYCSHFQPAMAPIGPGRFPPVTWFKWHSPYSRRKWRKSTSPRGQHHDKPLFIMHRGRWRTRLAGGLVCMKAGTYKSSRLNKNSFVPHKQNTFGFLLCALKLSL